MHEEGNEADVVSSARACRRGFVQFVYEPIKTIIECCMADNREKLWKLTDSLGVTPKLKS